MSEPKYSVGEVVILQSTMMPELNGEYEVECCFAKQDWYICALTGDKQRVTGLGYRLHGLTPDVGGWEALFKETALRKKHQGSDDSFEEMMSKLKIGEKV